MENGNNQFPYDQSKDSAAKSTKSDYEQLDPQTLQNITNAFFQRSQNVNTGNNTQIINPHLSIISKNLLNKPETSIGMTHTSSEKPLGVKKRSEEHQAAGNGMIIANMMMMLEKEKGNYSQL